MEGTFVLLQDTTDVVTGWAGKGSPQVEVLVAAYGWVARGRTELAQEVTDWPIFEDFCS
jgi:hypothetical protein